MTETQLEMMYARQRIVQAELVRKGEVIHGLIATIEDLVSLLEVDDEARQMGSDTWYVLQGARQAIEHAHSYAVLPARGP